MKHRKLILAAIGVAIVGLLVVLVVYKYRKNDDASNGPVNVVSEVGRIQDFDYVLEDRDTELFKEVFSSLKSILEKETIDYEEYAKELSKLYIIDLFTIDNKINQYDVGGLEYVHPDAKDNFDLKVRETLYQFVEDNSYGKRNQELPEVSSIEVVSIEEETEKIADKDYNGYTVDLSWDYKSDLGYERSATLKLVKVDKTLYIIKQDKKKSTQ